MTVELINQTTWANIYGVYDKAGKPIGTVEAVLAGREAGSYFAYTLSGRYTKRDIMRFYRER